MTGICSTVAWDPFDLGPNSEKHFCRNFGDERTDLRQQPQETFEDFFKAVVKLRNQQRVPYSEQDLVEIMRLIAALIFPLKISGLIISNRRLKRQKTYWLAKDRRTSRGHTQHTRTPLV